MTRSTLTMLKSTNDENLNFFLSTQFDLLLRDLMLKFKITSWRSVWDYIYKQVSVANSSIPIASNRKHAFETYVFSNTVLCNVCNIPIKSIGRF